jgi:sulfur-carrier protein
MPIVKLYGNLRRLSPSPNLEVPGETIAEVVATLCASNPDLCEALMQAGQVRSHVRIMLAGRDIELAAGMQTRLEPGDAIAIFPPIAGGSQQGV